MAYPSNEGGIGGKFTRRTSARIPSKPYDRPPTALRGVRGGGQVAGEGGGWMSKLLDPASRLIASGASKLFASMFRKRLTAPPLDSGISEIDHPGADVSRHASTHLLSETRNGDIHNGGCIVDNQTNRLHNGGSSVNNQKNSSDCGLGDLEQLLKQKTFTTVEFNHLEELLRSRTVESSNGNHENSGDKKGKSVVLASDDIPGSSKVHKMFPSNGLASQIQIPMTEVSSPAEVAKAYMGSRPNKEFSLSGSFRDQAFNEETKLKSMGSDPRCLNLSVAPRSVIRLSGVPEQHQYQNHAYQTTKLVGRTAMYRMSRSPYFKVNCGTSTQIGEISRDDRSSPVSSHWKSHGKQALKRGITALDDEYGSFGPIRRIRQKSNLVSPSRINNSAASMQKSLYLEGRKYDSTSSETAKDKTENSTILPVQSSEKAHKLFQQLDKLLPSSPKEKPSELKAMTIDESPSKLTLDMLHGRALKSTEDIKSSNFFSTHEVGKAAIATSQQNAVNSQSTRENTDEESKLPQNHAYNGMDVKASQANGVSKITLSSKNVTKPAPMIQKKLASSSVSIPTSKAPSFRISAPVDSFDLDDEEDDNTNHLLVPSTSTLTTKISAQNGTCSKTSSENLISSSVLSKNDEKDAIPPVLNKKENEFAFPVASDPSTQSQPPPTPSMPIPRFNTQVSQKETEQNPIPSLGSKDVKLSTNDAGVNVGEGFRSETTLTTGNSTTTNLANESTMVQSEAPKTEDAPKSPSAASEPSTISTPPLFSFGTSSTFSLSNGSLNPSLNKDPLPSNSIIENNTPTNSILNVSSVSSAAATFSTTAPTTLFQQSNTEAKAFNSSTFSPALPTSAPSMTTTTTASSSPAISSAFSSTPSTVFGFGASTQSIGSTVFGASNGSTTTSTAFGSSSQNSKPIVFGATDNNSSQNSKPVVFGATDNSSSQNYKPVVFAATDNNSSQKPKPAVFFGATDNNSSQKPKPVVFGATDNSSQNPKPVVFGATDNKTDNNSSQNPKPAVFGAIDNNSSQNSKPVVFGATDNSTQNSTTPVTFGTVTFGAGNNNSNNSSQNSSMTAFGASSTTAAATTTQKPDSITFGFGASNNNPQKPSAITFGATDNNNNIPANNGSSSAFGTQSTQSSASQFGLFSSSPSFGNSAFGSSASSSPNPFTSNLFGSSSQASSNTSASAPVFGSSTSSSAPFQFGSSGSGFMFGSSAPGSTSTPTPFTFNSSSASSTTPFTFNSSSTSTPTFGFGANSTSNDQMSVEDSMTDAASQAPAPTFPAFGQPQNPTATAPGFMFGSPAPTFSFGGAQNPPVQQQPFQPGGGLDFNPGGSFSLGSGGGGDKAGRKIIKVKRGPRGRK